MHEPPFLLAHTSHYTLLGWLHGRALQGVDAAWSSQLHQLRAGIGSNIVSAHEPLALPQVVIIYMCRYYFYAYFQVVKETGDDTPVNFSVPTGNFGDVLACHYAKKMGLNVGKLIVATNENDILARFFNSGLYERRAPITTISPSMDICVSSNFERYLFHSMEQDATSVNQLMQHFESKLGSLKCLFPISLFLIALPQLRQGRE